MAGSPNLGGWWASNMEQDQVRVQLPEVGNTAFVVSSALEVEGTVSGVLTRLPGAGMDTGRAPAFLMESVAQRLEEVAVVMELEEALCEIRPPKQLDLRDTHRELGPGSPLDLAQRPLGLASAGAEETLT